MLPFSAQAEKPSYLSRRTLFDGQRSLSAIDLTSAFYSFIDPNLQLKEKLKKQKTKEEMNRKATEAVELRTFSQKRTTTLFKELNRTCLEIR